jgi:hypothetical protein
MRKLLERLYVIQKKKHVDEHGTYTLTLKRLNPYHPLTYIVIPMYYALAIAMYGFVGYKQEMDSDFFRWQ